MGDGGPAHSGIEEPRNSTGAAQPFWRRHVHAAPVSIQGLWQSGADVFQDHVVVFTVMDFRSDSQIQNLRYLERLKTRLKKKLEQLEILITVQVLRAI